MTASFFIFTVSVYLSGRVSRICVNVSRDRSVQRRRRPIADYEIESETKHKYGAWAWTSHLGRQSREMKENQYGGK